VSVQEVRKVRRGEVVKILVPVFFAVWGGSGHFVGLGVGEQAGS